ncbi:MAG: hypothetical protein ACLT9S_01645 [Faecalibacterium sp.]
MSTTTNFWELLQQRQDELTKSGRAVADYLVHHADEAQYLSISSLAQGMQGSRGNGVPLLPGIGL